MNSQATLMVQNYTLTVLNQQVYLRTFTIDAAGANKQVWHVGYQDVIAIGELFTTGKINSNRVVSLAGPGINNSFVRTLVGASLEQLVEGEALADVELRVISGSVLHGTVLMARMHTWGVIIIVFLAEGREKLFAG